MTEKEIAIAELKNLIKESTTISTIIISANNGTYKISCFIAKDDKIIRISHLISKVLDLKLNKEQEIYTGKIGVNPYFYIAYQIGNILFGKQLPYQAL